ncbi:MAG: AAA family ATPase [Proteobacteria bacterium]|nr:AAA family ATPase [Pseudomonadota bacterium]
MNTAASGGAAAPAPADAATLRAAIAALESQRSTLGDAVAELALAPLRQLLAQAEAADADAAPQLRRAQVTVLFADIVDSTALASRLDAEDVLQVFGRVLERAAACVRARGGRVLRYTGDGLKAGFGTQGTREDDAAQAVAAALDILAAGREHAGWVAREHGVDGFALRVGAHTGEVALGAGFEADNTLSGDTVNIAARMEQTAPAGALRISAETWAHVRGRFEAEAQAPLAVKGLAEPLQTWLVRKARPGAQQRSARGIDGVPTRMVGREAELALLQSACSRLCDANGVAADSAAGFAAITVVGDAGIGKSRLLDEFSAWRHGQPARVLELHGHTTPQTEGQIFGLLRDILARHLCIADDDPPEVARAKMERGVVPLFIDDDGPDLAEGHAHLLGHLIGIEWRDSRHIKGILDDPRQLRQRAVHAAVQWFGRLARREGCPLLLQLEDLHWADVESLDFLDQLAAASADVPLLMLAATRPTLFERRAGWGERLPRHRRVDLAPLGPDGSRVLVAELLRKLQPAPPGLAEQLARHAEGNPFYLEELVKMLIDRGDISTGDAWTVDLARLALTAVPSTLTGVLQARLDSLPAPEKRALQQASVVGPVFWPPALAAIEAAAVAQLPALVRRALVRPLGAVEAAGLGGYAFHHQLLQQVTYGTVLKQERRAAHARVARWMATLTGLRAGDFLGAAAQHFERAGDDASAIEFHARSAEQAVQRFAHERVLQAVGRAMALLGDAYPAQSDVRWRLLSVREQTLALQGRRDEQAADLDAMAALAEATHDDRRRADVARRRSLRAMRTADWPRQELAARDSLDAATRAGDDELRLQALRLLASARTLQNDVAGGCALAEQGLADARRLGLRSAEAVLLNVVNAGAALQGDLLRSLALTQQTLVILRETGNRANEAIALSNLGGAWMKLGRLTEARPHLEAALQMLRANGDRTMEGAVLGILSALLLWQGDAARALALAQAAVDSTRATQARDMAVFAWLKVGHAELALGRLDAARQACAEALAQAEAIGHPTRLDAHAGLAGVALAQGHAAAARAAVEPVLAHVAAGGTLDDTEYTREVEWRCHQALAAADDPRAEAWLARAHEGLMAQADALPDPALRHDLLHNIPHHHEIVAAWAARAR